MVPCKLWKGRVTPQGYGAWCFLGRDWPAHRVVFLKRWGWLPPVVRHRCDVRLCVEPFHLQPGTNTDNMRDMVQRERSSGKLTWAYVEEIRSRYRDGETQSALGREFGVTQAQVSNIVREKQWIR